MLEVQDLHFAYKNRPIFQGLHLEVQDGEIIGIVGPNGAGKSTLLRLISGVLKPDSGKVTVKNTDLSMLNTTERARLVSVVPQNPQLPLGFRAIDLVLMGRNPHMKLLQWEGRRDMEVAQQAMSMTHTWELADRPLGNLSGGERQRALVAMALAQEAPVMLLDEPTSSLDLAHQTGIMDLVRNVQRGRGATVLAMHDLTLAAQYCNRIVLIHEGRNYVEGLPEEVLTQENIKRVYGADVIVMPHPQTGTPIVLPISNEQPNGRTNGQGTHY